MAVYNYTKVVASDRLELEIRESNITVALDYITTSGSNLDIYFKASLSEAEETALDGLVTAHVATALEDNTIKPVSVQEQPPFATPSYRTKRDKTPSILEISASSSETIDFLITEERYVSGGGIVYTGAKIGDYLTAEVYDVDQVIPSPYRTALCENWPSVSKYIIGQWIPEGNGVFEINTYPLNAKITAGLYLRVTYVASSETGTRKLGVNYHLTKKL